MPDSRDIPLMRWGEDLRRGRNARRRGRISHLASAAAAAAATAALATLVWPARPILLWNASASAPIGLYQVSAPNGIERGDMVVAWPPGPARRLAAERGYLPANVPLVKRVAAAPGERVCAAGEAIYLDGRVAAFRREMDGAGRRLPSWTGCIDLGEGQLFLLMEGSGDSFDGRYFGASEIDDVVGRARPLWAR